MNKEDLDDIRRDLAELRKHISELKKDVEKFKKYSRIKHLPDPRLDLIETKHRPVKLSPR